MSDTFNKHPNPIVGRLGQTPTQANGVSTETPYKRNEMTIDHSRRTAAKVAG